MVYWIEILGAIIFAVAVLIPLAMATPMVFGVISAWREHRAEDARRITCQLPDLGEFTTTDDELWFGDVQGIMITLSHLDGPPTAEQATLVQKLLADLPRLVEEGRRYLAIHEDCSRLDGGADAFEAFGLEPEDESVFVLELTHPSDEDGVYRVEFRSGTPVSSGRDD